jgi:hypothetical protein
VELIKEREQTMKTQFPKVELPYDKRQSMFCLFFCYTKAGPLVITGDYFRITNYLEEQGLLPCHVISISYTKKRGKQTTSWSLLTKRYNREYWQKYGTLSIVSREQFFKYQKGAEARQNQKHSGYAFCSQTIKPHTRFVLVQDRYVEDNACYSKKPRTILAEWRKLPHAYLKQLRQF